MRYGILMSRVYERLMHEYTGFSYIYVCTHEIRKSSMRMSTIMYIQKSRIVTRMVMSLLLDLRCHDDLGAHEVSRCHCLYKTEISRESKRDLSKIYFLKLLKCCILPPYISIFLRVSSRHLFTSTKCRGLTRMLKSLKRH